MDLNRFCPCFWKCYLGSAISKCYHKNCYFETLNFLATKTKKKYRKQAVFGTFYGCGGRTRTYDLRVMSGDILNFFNLKSRVYLRIIKDNRIYLSSNKIHFPQI